MDVKMVSQVPLALPEPQSPNGQLDFELSKHASSALQAIREKEEDKEILELLTVLDKKVYSMK